MSLDYGKIKEAAKSYEKDMTRFLREIVKNPGDQLLSGMEDLSREYPGRFTLLPCATNFAAMKLPDGEGLFRYLGERGIAIRYTGGLVRITCGTPWDERPVAMNSRTPAWRRRRRASRAEAATPCVRKLTKVPSISKNAARTAGAPKIRGGAPTAADAPPSSLLHAPR